MDIFIHLLYFCPPQPRLGAIVCWNAGKVYLGQIYLKKLGPEVVIESGSHISYTRTLEEQTLVYLSCSPPNLSMMLVWNILADPHL